MGANQCKVLIVGCPPRIGVGVGASLGRHGVTVVSQDFVDLESTVPILEPDLMIVQVIDGDPEATMATVRSITPVPVVLVAPPGSAPTITVTGLRAGADDVLADCVDPEELALRIETFLRRHQADGLVRVHDVIIDHVGHLAWRGTSPLHLTPIEFDVLSVLARQAGSVVTKRELLAAVWDYDALDVNVVEVHMSALRRKLEAHGPRMIHTVRSMGYVIRTRGYGGEPLPSTSSVHPLLSA